MKIEPIKKAIELLRAHAEEDFVSKADATECANNMQNLLNNGFTHSGTILDDIMSEVKLAETKHPDWPRDMVYAATIVAEENGELTRACLQFQREGGSIDEVEKEAIQTAATCIRLLKNL